jgi:hypothetical protein
MAADIRRALSPTVVFGVGLVVVGVLLTLQSAHLITVEALRQYWPLGIVAVGIAFVLQPFLARNAGESEQPRDFHWGPLIVVLIAGTFWTHVAGRTSNGTQTGSSDHVRVTAIMSGSSLVSRSPAFHGAEVTSVLGGSQLDLRQATIAPGEEAVIDVDALMGGIVIRVPEQWQVDVGTTMIMGAVDDQRPKALHRKSTEAPEKLEGPPAPILKVKGTIVMGGLVIKL